jgi:alpha-glucan,water dikinase
MTQSGLPWPQKWDDAWTCIKGVWASKWNDRAFFSRKARGIPHQDLFMAVLIQEVIEADYSFVVHTVNPVSGNWDEIYAEVVLGLGEALVGNYPGRALSFTSKKGVHDPHITTFPSKSMGLYGGGLIFRSDSNGEDLAGFAGAGLYDSFLLPPPRNCTLDYTDEPLCWNDPFRNNFLVSIAVIGTTVERLLDFPQDIEGAYSRGQYFVVQTRPQVGLKGD